MVVRQRTDRAGIISTDTIEARVHRAGFSEGRRRCNTVGRTDPLPTDHHIGPVALSIIIAIIASYPTPETQHGTRTLDILVAEDNPVNQKLVLSLFEPVRSPGEWMLGS